MDTPKILFDQSGQAMLGIVFGSFMISRYLFLHAARAHHLRKGSDL